jgi:hypothetical protein
MCHSESERIQSIFNNLVESGIDPNLAYETAKIIAKDDPSKANLGRSPEEQKTVAIAWQQFWQLN